MCTFPSTLRDLSCINRAIFRRYWWLCFQQNTPTPQNPRKPTLRTWGQSWIISFINLDSASVKSENHATTTTWTTDCKRQSKAWDSSQQTVMISPVKSNPIQDSLHLQPKTERWIHEQEFRLRQEYRIFPLDQHVPGREKHHFGAWAHHFADGRRPSVNIPPSGSDMPQS